MCDVSEPDRGSEEVNPKISGATESDWMKPLFIRRRLLTITESARTKVSFFCWMVRFQKDSDRPVVLMRFLPSMREKITVPAPAAKAVSPPKFSQLLATVRVAPMPKVSAPILSKLPGLISRLPATRNELALPNKLIRPPVRNRLAACALPTIVIGWAVAGTMTEVLASGTP